ncbi:MAG: hypothetical protein ABJF04_19645 [Reichenbachiella sp.]|uniref:hypothetical protein n=1 Tax=Reichenbachiella sp. TaxID=2184521 RepID=UPI003266CE4C
MMTDPLENYQAYFNEFQLLKRRLKTQRNLLDDTSDNYIQFVSANHWISKHRLAHNEISHLIHFSPNLERLYSQLASDYLEIDEWIGEVKKANASIAELKITSSVIVNSKDIVLDRFHRINWWFHTFYDPIVEKIPKVLIESTKNSVNTSEYKNIKQKVFAIFNQNIKNQVVSRPENYKSNKEWFENLGKELVINSDTIKQYFYELNEELRRK